MTRGIESSMVAISVNYGVFPGRESQESSRKKVTGSTIKQAVVRNAAAETDSAKTDELCSVEGCENRTEDLCRWYKGRIIGKGLVAMGCLQPICHEH